jgi:hypothetical protein
VQFAAPAEHYDRFMGRYLPTLAAALADAAGVTSGMRVVDVGCGPGDLEERLRRAGLKNVAGGVLEARADYAGFDDFWEPFTFAVGPAGQHLHSLSEERRTDVREELRAEVPDGPFTLEARAWFARGTVA